MTPPPSHPPHPVRDESGVSVIIPCYEEEGAVEGTIADVHTALSTLGIAWEIIAVNDGSDDATGRILDSIAGKYSNLRIVHNLMNRGYGASLKRGIAESRYDRVAITDADGTYPNARLPELIGLLDNADMVVGARTGKNVHIPLARRPAKWALLKYARWMARADIKDINSGMRAVWKQHVARVWGMLPDGFSFTTTITMACHVNRLKVDYVPIDYFKRVGASSIHPIKDTIRFFSLVLRTTMYFRPLPVFGTLACILMGLAIVIAAAFKVAGLPIPDISTIILFVSGLNFLGLGLLGDLVNARRSGA